MATIIHPDGKEEKVSVPQLQQLKFLQNIVGGFIEFAWCKDGKIICLNEEGKLKELPHNPKATELYQKDQPHITDYIVGTVLVCDPTEVD